MKAFKQTYLVLSAQSYRIVDEKTGEVNEGISMWYIPDDNLDPEVDEVAAGRGQMARGKKVAKMALPINTVDKLKDFPALYEVTLEMVTVANKQQVRPRDIDYVSTVKLVPEKAKQ